MKKSTIAIILIGAYIGGSLSAFGYHFYSWQYWAVLLPLIFGTVIYGELVKGEK